MPQALFLRLGSFNGSSAKIFHQLAKFQRCFTCTGTCSFVVFGELKFGIGLENSNLFVDLVY